MTLTDIGNVTTEESMEETHVDEGSQSQLTEDSVQWAKRTSRVNAN